MFRNDKDNSFGELYCIPNLHNDTDHIPLCHTPSSDPPFSHVPFLSFAIPCSFLHLHTPENVNFLRNVERDFARFVEFV